MGPRVTMSVLSSPYCSGVGSICPSWAKPSLRFRFDVPSNGGRYWDSIVR